MERHKGGRAPCFVGHRANASRENGAAGTWLALHILLQEGELPWIRLEEGAGDAEVARQERTQRVRMAVFPDPVAGSNVDHLGRID